MIKNITSPRILVIQTQQKSSCWEIITGILGDAQTWWPIIAFALVLVVATVASRWMNRLTRNTLENLKHSGKYIRDIYVEPYGIAETLRYFLFGTEKKRQLILWRRKQICNRGQRHNLRSRQQHHRCSAPYHHPDPCDQ